MHFSFSYHLRVHLGSIHARKLWTQTRFRGWYSSLVTSDDDLLMFRVHHLHAE